MKSEAGRAFRIDELGNPIIDAKDNTSYYGHHMLNVRDYPEYAGEWRNIQALTHDEHYKGAHPNGNTNAGESSEKTTGTKESFMGDGDDTVGENNVVN